MLGEDDAIRRKKRFWTLEKRRRRDPYQFHQVEKEKTTRGGESFLFFYEKKSGENLAKFSQSRGEIKQKHVGKVFPSLFSLSPSGNKFLFVSFLPVSICV